MSVWKRDTVASVGWIPRSTLPFSSSANPSVKYFRQAFAFDERRSKFKQNSWVEALNDVSTSAAAMDRTLDPDVLEDSLRLKEVLGMPVVLGAGNKRPVVGLNRRSSLNDIRQTSTTQEEVAFNKLKGNRGWKTDVVECWFSGAHCGMFQSQVS